MDISGSLFVFLVFACCSELVRANGCANLPPNHPVGEVINICDENTVTAGGLFYLSGSSAEMGSMTRCNCSIVALTQEARVSSVVSAGNIPQFTRCNATWHILGSTEETFTCQNTQNFRKEMNTSIVTIDIRRQILDDFDFCLYVTREDYVLENSYNVTCENSGTTDSTAAIPPAESTTKPNNASTSTEITTLDPSMISAEIASPPSSSSMASRPTSKVSETASTTEETTSPTEITSSILTSSVTSQYSGNSDVFTSSHTAMSSVPETESTITQSSSVASVSTTTIASEFPVVAVAAGIGGSVCLIIIIVIVVLCLSCRRRREREQFLKSADVIAPRRPTDPRESLQDNPLYGSGSSSKKASGHINSNPVPSPDDFMVDNVLYESSSFSKKPSGNMHGSPAPNPEDFMVDNVLYESSSSKKFSGNMKGNPAPSPDDFMVDNVLYESSSAIKANGVDVHPNQSSTSIHSQEPISDAGRGGGQLGIKNNHAVKGSQGLPSGQDNGGGVKTKEIVPRPQYPPPAPPASAEAAASSESASDGPTPGLNHAAVDFRRGTAMASSRPQEPPTEYTTIDLDATKKLSVVC